MRRVSLLFLIGLLLASYPLYLLFRPLQGSTIVLGMSGPLSGGLTSVGSQFLLGANLYFKEVNDKGGVHGRMIKVIAKDDRHEPQLGLDNAKTLVEEDKVFALFGTIGTPIAEAIFPYALKTGTPLVGTYSGAAFLRNPPNSLVLNARAGDWDEIEALVHHYVDTMGYSRVALLYQNDGYGRAGLHGLIHALRKRNLSLCAEGSYKRNTLSVGNALYEIQQANPEVIIAIGTTPAVAQFIKRARKSESLSKEVEYGLLSFIEPTQLVELLDGAMQKILFAHVVPSPWTSQVDEVKYYRYLMQQHYPKMALSYVSLEGFFAARMMVEVLKSVGEGLTKEHFIAALEAFSKSLDANATSKNRDERCKCLHKVHLSHYVDHNFFVLGEKP